MPALSPYKSELDYAYAPGIFPAMDCMLHRADCARRLLLHTKAAGTEGAEKLIALAQRHHVRVEEADKALARVSGKENCFAAVVFTKFQDTLNRDKPHVVLHLSLIHIWFQFGAHASGGDFQWPGTQANAGSGRHAAVCGAGCPGTAERREHDADSGGGAAHGLSLIHIFPCLVSFMRITMCWWR